MNVQIYASAKGVMSLCDSWLEDVDGLNQCISGLVVCVSRLARTLLKSNAFILRNLAVVCYPVAGSPFQSRGFRSTIFGSDVGQGAGLLGNLGTVIQPLGSFLVGRKMQHVLMLLLAWCIGS